MSFIAHPDDNGIEWLGEPAIPWLDRYVDGFTGLEVWNYMSRFKDYLPDRRTGIRNVFRPDDVVTGPSPVTLALWDELLEMGLQVVGIGCADATLRPLPASAAPAATTKSRRERRWSRMGVSTG